MRYNCSILDLYDRSIVATLNSDYINTELAKATLEKALMEEKPEKGLILHSDQGCQFTSWGFINYCESRGICQSMSKAGCPYDNAPMERFYNTLKNELIYPNHFYDAASLDEALNRYVYVWLYWSSFLVTLCSEIMLYIETPLVSYSYSLNEVSHSCTS